MPVVSKEHARLRVTVDDGKVGQKIPGGISRCNILQVHITALSKTNSTKLNDVALESEVGQECLFHAGSSEFLVKL